MKKQRKPYLTYVLLFLAPLFVLAVLNYWNGVSGVQATLETQLQDRLDTFTLDLDRRIEEKENELRRLSTEETVRKYLSEGGPSADVQLKLALVLSESVKGVALLDQNRRSVLPVGSLREIQWTHEDILATRELLVSMQGSIFQLTFPVLDDTGSVVKGFLVGQIDLTRVIQDSARVLEKSTERGNAASSLVIVLDTSKRLLYHTDHSLEGKTTGEVFQQFDPVAQHAVANGSGVKTFQYAGHSFLAAYGPIPRRSIAIAVAEQPQLRSARLWGLAGLIFAIAAALVAAKLLGRYVQGRSRGLEHITEGVSAVAKGEIDRQIILRSSDDARGLADNINVVIEKLRAQIAKEEETRQFNSFVRLSAMLTHDLKNSIEALSLTVGNMERHFDNPQFRADALKSLTSATDKLKGIVARLTKPLTSLSGEHKRPMDVDLIPILNRVLAVTAEPSRGKHSIDIKLPQTLTALADPAKIEEVMENLVINALEAMGDKKGKLTIEAGRNEKGAATFSVGDTGPGMSPEFIRTQLFRPFATTKKAGVGLGLYTCREVVAAHAGTIEVDSVEGAGTTFRVVLPSTSHDRRK
jgi:signal transduction histidine kinase